MTISVFAEHSVCMDLLPREATIIDIGCRGFQFVHEMWKLGHIVFPIDIDELPEGEDLYFRCAITSRNGRVGIERFNDNQATRVKPGNEIDSFTIESFIANAMKGVRPDLIKMDCEGAEYEIIMGLERPPAQQLSIEMHLHTGAYKVFEVNMMENKLRALGYDIARHEYENRHGAGFNYYDSLFILK